MATATKLRFGVVIFPGSNCDTDAWHALHDQMGQSVDYIWHQETKLTGYDCLIIPGGFSYGDYLRTGAVARFSPVMNAVSEFAANGGLVIGICNGFQILLEAGLLPGAMLRNRSLRFQCEPVHIRVEQTDTPFTCLARTGQVLEIPIAHGEGTYFADPDVLTRLEANRQVVFRYTTAAGEVTDAANPNGSARSIAGLCNEARNVVGLMPHPERACEPALGTEDGRVLFESVIQWIARGREKAALQTAGAGRPF